MKKNLKTCIAIAALICSSLASAQAQTFGRISENDLPNAGDMDTLYSDNFDATESAGFADIEGLDVEWNLSNQLQLDNDELTVLHWQEISVLTDYADEYPELEELLDSLSGNSEEEDGDLLLLVEELQDGDTSLQMYVVDTTRSTENTWRIIAEIYDSEETDQDLAFNFFDDPIVAYKVDSESAFDADNFNDQADLDKAPDDFDFSGEDEGDDTGENEIAGQLEIDFDAFGSVTLPDFETTDPNDDLRYDAIRFKITEKTETDSDDDGDTDTLETVKYVLYGIDNEGNVDTEEPLFELETGDYDEFGLHKGTGSTSNNVHFNKSPKKSLVSGVSSKKRSFNFVKVYPNPANQQVTVAFSKSQEAATLTISNLLGQPILSSTLASSGDLISTNTIDISPLNKGIYMLSITSGNGKPYSTKLVVQ